MKVGCWIRCSFSYCWSNTVVLRSLVVHLGTSKAGSLRWLSPPFSSWNVPCTVPTPVTSSPEWIPFTRRIAPGSFISETKSDLSRFTQWEAPESQITEKVEVALSELIKRLGACRAVWRSEQRHDDLSNAGWEGLLSPLAMQKVGLWAGRPNETDELNLLLSERLRLLRWFWWRWVLHWYFQKRCFLFELFKTKIPHHSNNILWSCECDTALDRVQWGSRRIWLFKMDALFHWFTI